MKETLVIKLGGMLLNNNTIIHRFFEILYNYYQSMYQNILIIHGGESWINYNYNNTYFSNTKDSTSNIVCYNTKISNMMKLDILSGTINKNIILHAKKNHFNTVGLCLTDGNDIILNSSHINYENVVYSDSCSLIRYLFSRKILPVISPIGITKDNILISIDSDVAAMLLAISLKAKLIILTDINGILDGKGNEIKVMTQSLSHQLISSGIITHGMVVKVNTAIQVSKVLHQSVNIASLINFIQLKKIFSKDIIGTLVCTNK
ncbi:acetylglutamate kinase [Buchnera aphidicola]|uniref:amino acid kinase family protein n=1 Tax=Buchnera aphidicola TaxID=9 RepID=UPI0034638515